MKPTGMIRWLKRDLGPRPVLQQEMIGYKDEIWENEVLIACSSNELVKEWIDVIEIHEHNMGESK